MKERYALDTGVISLCLSGNGQLKWLSGEIDEGNALTTGFNLTELATLITSKAGLHTTMTHYNRVSTPNPNTVDTYEKNHTKPTAEACDPSG